MGRELQLQVWCCWGGVRRVMGGGGTREGGKETRRTTSSVRSALSFNQSGPVRPTHARSAQPVQLHHSQDSNHSIATMAKGNLPSPSHPIPSSC